ncbi:helix-turn-helix domain-containing protein [Micromonospora tarensis]|uniref:helix-turn-helix domain-containing protein n=1 Tax=Micromonospora tarensis TaxID=2806100 RepID=UPI0028166CC0|nr:helix-turn-helix transcriptional regulator [Micromonospora tarensis]
MIVSAAPPPELAQARADLGKRLAEARKSAGYTQETLAPLTHYVRSTIANVERGRQSIGRDFWVRCDEILQTGGVLAVEYDRLRVLVTRSTAGHFDDGRARGATVATRTETPGPTALSLLAPQAANGDFAPQTYVVDLWAPAGRFFPGLAIPAFVHPAVAEDGRVLAAVPAGYCDDRLLRTPRRSLVVGRIETDQGAQLFGLDARHARQRLAQAPPDARLVIPQAYQLDELVLALLWAVANLDEALLADDARIEQATAELASYEQMSRSAVSHDLAADVSDVGRMWLGSVFCAGHIHRHAEALTSTPAYWTREQRGEEASTWLLFAHKLRYLDLTAARAGSHRIIRAFCIPRAAVDASPRGERILLLLAVALMESYGIEVVITDEPEYAGTPGFVTDSDRHAVLANWVGAQGIWHVDVSDDHRTVRQYGAAINHASGRSVIAAASPPARLRVLTEYLDLNWETLASRCRDLADQGCAAVVKPRSRHLSTAGIDRACRYLADAAALTD